MKSHTGIVLLSSRRAVTAAMAAVVVATGLVAHSNDEVPHEARGFSQSGYSLSSYESINLANGNLVFRIPLYRLETDGGLSYELALHHNSKVWLTHRFCSLDPGGYSSCAAAGGSILEAEVAHGVESFGFGWDMRPPRIVFLRNEPYPRAAAYVDASGAKRGLSATPPWELDGDGGAGFGFESSAGDRFYTRDGSNFRFTVREVDPSGRPTRIEMEDGFGDVHVFAQIVPTACDADRSLNPNETDLEDFNFRVETAGLYLSEIQRGPWHRVGGSVAPSNRIVFSYQGQVVDWDDGCGVTGAEPWLPNTIGVSGEAERSVELRYEPGTSRLAEILIPAFNPVIGDHSPSPNREEIVLTTRTRVFEQRLGTSTVGFTAAHLERVSFPDGSSFELDRDLVSGQPPLAEVILPSGARIRYGMGFYPVGRGRCEDLIDSGDECVNWTTCGAAVPFFEDQPSTELVSQGVAWREIFYHDAATDPGEPRLETTWFSQGLNCSVNPSFTQPPNQLYPWPYDFDFALRDDAGLLHPEYLWTVVFTSGGAVGPGSQGVAKIHRFHPVTREEFSMDELAGDSETLAALPLLATTGIEDLSGSDLRVLRHAEFERRLKFGANYPSMVEGGDRYQFIRQRRVYTDERSSDRQAEDVESCYPPVFANADGIRTRSATCAETRETREVDQYLNETSRSVVSFRSASGYEVAQSRHTEYWLDGVEQHWYLHRSTGGRLCDAAGCSITAATWADRSTPGTRGWFVVTREVENPGPDGSCTADCIERVFGYDAVGHRDEIGYRGGYGVGFGLLEVTDRKDFRHGRPIRASRHGGAKSILLWERETDPGTGLVRWHLSGSGDGFAYGYDPAGNLSDVVPIEGERVGGVWSIELQRASDGQPLFGSRVRRIFPTESQLLRHEVYDARYSLDSTATGVSVALDHLVGDPMSSFEFDGLGRRARTEERYPSRSGTRVRLSLDFMTDGPPPCGSGGGTRLDHETRIILESEWMDRAEIWSCGDFHWNETQHDTLGRPAIVRLADGNEVFHEYVGDSRHTTTRSVGTSAGGFAEWLSTTSVSDALGRLRRLDEEVDGGEFHVAEYDYDRLDRLTTAVLWRGEPSVSSRQVRTFTYSDSGFLVVSDEPERTVTMLGHDALGNTRAEQHGDVTTELFYDDIGRQVARVANGLLTATWTWGDEPSGGGRPPGDPAYGRVVESRQHNRFGPSDVVVTSRWGFDGPGARVDSKSVIVDGVGGSGDGFTTTHGYDRWGELSSTTHPIWTGWESQCQRPVEQSRERLGDWLVRSGLGIADGAESYGSHLDYRASGRVELERYTAFETQAGVLYEDPDAHGMARPGGFALWWSAPFGGSGQVWTEGPYEYDGSGNVTRIGSRRYAYDGHDRLVAYHDASSAVESYDFDRWGNLYRTRNTDVVNGGGFTMLALGGTNDNRPDVVRFVGGGSGSLQWDSRGNLLGIPAVGPLREKSFVYSSEDRLIESLDVASGVTWRFAHDADGERVLSWRRSGDGPVDEVRLTLRNESGLALSDWLLVPETSFGPTTEYAHIGGRLGIQMDWVGDNAVARFAAHDHLGNTRVLVEPDGTVTDILEYYPYGGLRSGGPVPGSSHLFTGHERDLGSGSSELDNMHARHYSPNLSFFTSIDSVGGEASDSQSWNRYSYTSGNPLRAVDPDGRYEEDVHYHLTRYLALASGRTFASAEKIAKNNLLVDKDSRANPLFPRDFSLHFGPREQAVARAKEATDDASQLGAALHSVQDSFSHAGYGWPFGHGHKNVIGKSPDDPWRDVPKAMEMAELTFELLGGDTQNFDREFLEILFRTKSKKERIDMLEAAMTPSGVGVPKVVGITFADPEHLEMMIEYFRKSGYAIFF